MKNYEALLCLTVLRTACFKFVGVRLNVSIGASVGEEFRSGALIEIAAGRRSLLQYDVMNRISDNAVRLFRSALPLRRSGLHSECPGCKPRGIFASEKVRRACFDVAASEL